MRGGLLLILASILLTYFSSFIIQVETQGNEDPNYTDTSGIFLRDKFYNRLQPPW